jgi:hypothetical protein
MTMAAPGWVREAPATGLYMYCVVPAAAAPDFGSIGLSEDAGHGVHVWSLAYRDLACVVSESPIKVWDVSRANMVRHQRVTEMALARGPVLPIRYSTIAESRERLLENFLVDRYDELCERLGYFADKNEYGVRAMWPNMRAVYDAVMQENPALQAWRDRLAAMPLMGAQREMVSIGEEVRTQLAYKRGRLAKSLMDTLRPYAVEAIENPTLGDPVVLNGTFLVAHKAQSRFDATVDELAQRHGADLHLRYVGPIPPSSFIELVVNWEGA